ncbi:hypothetical protein IFM12276_50240 [Nocardia sputorum]|uniref:Uncharacterized protein n=1 Tax=Nocardia sputorum TaxID=2984338 RepID=A0ABM8D3W4_9NOCA|nr:hypothetical protein IFM12276_50240 [Nocardia sputorum]
MPGAAWAVETPPAAVKLTTASTAGTVPTNERNSRDAVMGIIFPQHARENACGCEKPVGASAARVVFGDEFCRCLVPN